MYISMYYVYVCMMDGWINVISMYYVCIYTCACMYGWIDEWLDGQMNGWKGALYGLILTTSQNHKNKFL